MSKSTTIAAPVAKSIVPGITAKSTEQTTGQIKGHNWFMMACCLAMVAGFAFVAFTGPADQTFWSRVFSASPLLVCVGMHLVMHRLMGKSCHLNKTEKEEIK